jgi:hypothetical protein
VLRRKQGERPPYERLLIVCEGKKTEPLYFEDVRIQGRVPSAHIKIVHSELGTEPIQVVESAEAEFYNAERRFDRVFAVFDRDEHLTYEPALKKAVALDQQLRNDEKRRIHFTAVPSVPNFEIWLLLHFEDIQAFGHRSEMITRLRQHIPDYEKGLRGIYALTEEHLPVATERAVRLRARFDALPGDDPFTAVDELVALMRTIRSARKGG